MQKNIITPSSFFQLDTCPLWIWYDHFGDIKKKEAFPELSLKLMEDGNIHEETYISSLKVKEVLEIDPLKGLITTITLMKQGEPLIYQGWLATEDNQTILRGRPDLLEKRKGTSYFGDWMYVPIDIKTSSQVKPIHKKQLAFYAALLEQIQGVKPDTVEIINRNYERLVVSVDKKLANDVQGDIDQILSILNGTKPHIHISSGTKQSPWYKVCLKEAEESNDISLIYGIRKETTLHLRSLGINTFVNLTKVNIESLPKINGASYDTLKKLQTQASALIKKEPILIGHLETSQTPLKLYFDIEGSKSFNVEYLFGFWVEGDPEGIYAKIGHVHRLETDGGKYFLYFLAESPDKESALWTAFLEYVACLPKDYSVIHYGIYEETILNRLAAKHRSSPALEKFQDRLINLEKALKQTVVLPLYFYSIKDIAKSTYVNFKWRHSNAGGAQSMFWYEQWINSDDRSILQDIIDYNEDDVRATEYVYKWLLNFSAKSLQMSS